MQKVFVQLYHGDFAPCEARHETSSHRPQPASTSFENIPLYSSLASFAFPTNSFLLCAASLLFAVLTCICFPLSVRRPLPPPTRPDVSVSTQKYHFMKTPSILKSTSSSSPLTIAQSPPHKVTTRETAASLCPCPSLTELPPLVLALFMIWFYRLHVPSFPLLPLHPDPPLDFFCRVTRCHIQDLRFTVACFDDDLPHLVLSHNVLRCW